MQKFFILILTVSIFSLAGCSKSPLQKLASDVVYTDMDNAFWSNQQEQKTALWSDAVSYCKQNANKPNCGAVMGVFALSNSSIEVPDYGTSGHVLTVPDLKNNK
jgi:hypothetical protein